MGKYSDFFRTLHDERAPTGHLGRGTHYSVLRAIVFNDASGKPSLGTDFDFAVIWDEDHDERVIQAIEKCYRLTILPSFIMLGERKGVLTGILAEGSQNGYPTPFLANHLHAVAQGMEDDPWTSAIATVQNPNNTIINDTDERVSLYLRSLQMLWSLGPKR